jgi:hypothetical protein
MGSTSRGVEIEVTCYSGYRGDERPSVMSRGGRAERVSEVMSRRREPDAELFVVRMEDGKCLKMRLDTTSGRWSAREMTR